MVDRRPTHNTPPAGGGGGRRTRGDPSFYQNGKAKRVGIRWPAGEFVGWMWLNVNPESFQVTLPTRLSVNQAFTGSFTDSLGFGLPSGAISGTCGFGLPLDNPEQGVTGAEQLRRLKRAYEAWQDASALALFGDGFPCEIMVGPTFDQHYTVLWRPEGLQIRHDAGKPFLFYYNLGFTVVYDWNWEQRARAAPLLGTGSPTPDDGSAPVYPGGVR